MHTRFASLGLFLAFGCSLGCGDGNAVPRDGAVPLADLTSDSGGAEAQVTVINGFGSGRYPVGAEIDVFADAPPETRTCNGWSGDVGELAEPGEWHTTLRVPARDVTVTATFLPSEATPTMRTYVGATSVAKDAYLFRPAGTIRGLLLFLHGTGGSARFAIDGEALVVVQRAVADGWAVLSPEAEEAAAGDLNGDMKERWDVAVAPTNTDLRSLNTLIPEVRAELALPTDAPNAVLGMSNGGAMALGLGAVAALDTTDAFPALRFRAAIVYCASGRLTQAMNTTTPTAFLGCANDDNDEVDLTEIEANSAALASRGIRTAYRLHPASPLHAERFTRVPGIDLATSTALVAELAGSLDATRRFNVGSDALVADIMARPAAYPTFAALAPAQQRAALSQVRAVMAAHQMYSDWAAYTLAFLDAP